ncbi:MAG: phenylalanine--tRNA ligase subunit beta, partial [Bacteroidetes bacterium]|nr:phenylalanine--tRNA ligase subunit beta [Bacteroidota bacterium]
GYNWLKQYANFNLSPKDLGEVLTGTGLEVEDITPFESIAGGLQGVVTGAVVECAKHPDADKLSVTRVDVGTGELLQIVCGAPNVAAGQKVVVALVGSTLYPSGGEKLTIKKAKIRGVESMGMICAEDELGLSDNHAGIMVLPADTAAGTPAAEYFKVENDYVLEIGLTPNRSDANSHIGVARDVVAALNVAYKTRIDLVKPDVSAFKATPSGQAMQVAIQDSTACPRYSGVRISNVEVKESPEWLKNRLKAIGLRAINNVVDATNYVLHEYGQPLHAFDAAQIAGNKIVVRKWTAADGKFKALDGVEYATTPDDLMICDAEKPMCIAGVFGGADSGVSESTKEIFLESACFASTGIRKTSTRLGLRTDAATHFEKGCDPNITVTALKRAALLIGELSGGQVSSEIFDHYPVPHPGWKVTVCIDSMLRLAGFSIDPKTIREILHHLEIVIEKEEGNTWHLLVPAFKTDVKREADVVEEMLRIYGYNSFTLPKSVKSALTFSPAINAQKSENLIADLLSGFGLNEVWTNSVSQSGFEEDESLKNQQVMLLNSQTAELDSLRTSILYSGLEVIRHNQNRKAADLRFYEFGKTYHKKGAAYEEQRHLSVFLTGKSFEDNWVGRSEAYSFYHLKNIVEKVLSKLGHHLFDKTSAEEKPFEFCLTYSNEGTEVVKFGAVAKSVLKKFDIKNPVFYADFNWTYLLEKTQYAHTSFHELPKFPSVKRDLAMLVNDELKFEAIEKIAYAESKKLLQEISLFDLYKGDKIEKGQKSYAVSFVFQHAEKTLTDAEIEKIMSRLMSKYESELGAIIRKG